MKPKLPKVLELLGRDPDRSTKLLKRKLAEARRTGQAASIHACLDALVPELLDLGDIDHAERCVRELLLIEEDASHVLMLARGCTAQGKTREGEQHLSRAATLVNNHLDEEERQLLEQAGIKPIGLPKK